MTVLDQAKAAKQAALSLMTLSADIKNSALLSMADALIRNAPSILANNMADVVAAERAGKSSAFIDRLSLNEARIEGMANGLRKVAALPDPIGGADAVIKRPNGLSIEKRRVPLGVIGIIFEARPNVTADAIGLCIKSGNACVLRGGSEAIRSNIAITDYLADAAYAAGIPKGAIQLTRDTDRATAIEMMRLNGYLDVLIPRGGAGLIRSVVEQASVPVIQTGVGVCHAFVDEFADIHVAANIVCNAKCSRPSVCNALETLLVHKSIAEKALPAIAKELNSYKVELRCDRRARAILTDSKEATELDWSTEYGDYILSIKIVDCIEEAIHHINHFGTGHSDCIITTSYSNAERFLNEVDSAAVYVNASTRFTDGEEFGLGAEIGISTQKLHARGPMGLNELTTVKYVVRGNGQTR
ncbi:MAG: glutamate-5-semialdehyde dehydrogenase [Clostridia bacterium]